MDHFEGASHCGRLERMLTKWGNVRPASTSHPTPNLATLLERPGLLGLGGKYLRGRGSER